MSEIGHNLPPLEQSAEHALRGGLYIAQRDALVRCIRDPQLEARHRVVLAELVMMTNTKIGMAYPGRRSLSERTGYSEGTIGTTIRELRAWGYVVSERRQPATGGRYLEHYVVTRPTLEDLQTAITAHVIAHRRKAEAARTDPGRQRFTMPNVNPALHVKDGIHVNPVLTLHVNPVVATVTSKRTCSGDRVDESGNRAGECRSERSSLSDAAFDLFDEIAAGRFGFSEARSRTESRRSRLTKRLKEIGGLDAWRRALEALQHDDFLSGRTRRQDRGPFDIDILLQTQGKMGDVLARLIDLAAKVGNPANRGQQIAERIAGMTDAEQAALVARECRAAGYWPILELGPPPGHRACAIRPAALREASIRPGTFDPESGMRVGAL